MPKAKAKAAKPEFTLRQLVAQVNAERKTIRTAEKKMSKLEQLMIEQSPIKVGDNVIVNYGWSHLKKTMKVTQIDVIADLDAPEYRYQGLVLKGDGTVGKFRAISRFPVLPTKSK